ncbi:hypothetical protein CR513_18593, partial [Mucuna pruriens]
MVTMFIGMIQSPFYDKMIGNVSSNFSNLVIIGERVEMGMRNGKIAQVETTTNTNKSPITAYKGKMGETNAIIPVSNPLKINFSTTIPTTLPTTNGLLITTTTSFTHPTSQTSPLGVPQPRNSQTRTFTPIPMTYTKLLPHLIQNSLVIPTSLKLVQPPYPKNYDSNAKSDYYAGAIGHTTERCLGLKYKVLYLMDTRLLSFKENGLNVRNNLFPSHEGT